MQNLGLNLFAQMVGDTATLQLPPPILGGPIWDKEKRVHLELAFFK